MSRIIKMTFYQILKLHMRLNMQMITTWTQLDVPNQNHKRSLWMVKNVSFLHGYVYFHFARSTPLMTAACGSCSATSILICSFCRLMFLILFLFSSWMRHCMFESLFPLVFNAVQLENLFTITSPPPPFQTVVMMHNSVGTVRCFYNLGAADYHLEAQILPEAPEE